MTLVKYKVGNAIFYNYQDAVDAHNEIQENVEVIYTERPAVSDYDELSKEINRNKS